MYHPLVSGRLPINETLLAPGLRLAVGVSGGADSVALLCALSERRAELGLVLHVAHLHHGLRGAEADGDLEFVRALAARLDLPFHQGRVDTEREARADPAQAKPAESIEEAARRLRYRWFQGLIASVPLDAVATAHTLDDQAETVLHRFLRGAWTEGLSGIHPVVDLPGGRILRPLLGVRRSEIESCLRACGHPWREDSSNRHLTFTRNRIRHELLPRLESWNPRLREHLAQMAELARDEERWWEAEVERVAPGVILEGRPVRGGGRAAGGGLALDGSRLAGLPPALGRRLVRYAARQLGVQADFAATEALRSLAVNGRAGQRAVSQGLVAERTHRELRLSPAGPPAGEDVPAVYEGAVPGEIEAPAFGLRVRIAAGTGQGAERTARLRRWRAGDRVRLRHSAAPRKVKEVLERLKVTGTDRTGWPVLEVEGEIVWMRGVDLEPVAGIEIGVEMLVPQGEEIIPQGE